MKFSSCMRKHGVNIPAPSGGGSAGVGPPAGISHINQSDPTVQAATKACQSNLPGGVPGAASGQ